MVEAEALVVQVAQRIQWAEVAAAGMEEVEAAMVETGAPAALRAAARVDLEEQEVRPEQAALNLIMAAEQEAV
jgi:hypothetical protein